MSDDEKTAAPSTITVTSIVGPFGWWQANIAAFYFVAYILSTFNNLGIAFHAAKTQAQCVEGFVENRTVNLSHTGQLSSENQSATISSCAACTSWTYNNSVQFDQTIISEFHLTCGREWMSSFSQSMYQLGYVFSGIFIGYLSDTYGRYRALCTAIVFEIIGGVVLISSQSIYIYILSRFLLGMGDSGRGLCLYMLIIETVGKRYRTDAILCTSFGWVIGYLLLPLVAYVVRSYRYLQVVPTLTITAMVILWLPTIPESPRWLLTKHRFNQARKILLKASRVNKTTKNFDDKFESLQSQFKLPMALKPLNAAKEESGDEKHKKVKIWDLFKSKKYRVLTPILWISFYVNGFIYHGFSLNVDIIGGNVFLNFALAGLIEIPSTVLNLVGMRHVGRKTFTICTILSAALCYIMIVISRLVWEVSDDSVPVIVLSMLGKMFIFSTYNAIYIHAGEIFPTQLRHSGVSSCSIAARAGSTVAPFVREIASSYGLTITIMIFGSMALITAFLTIFLPETKDKELVDRID